MAEDEKFEPLLPSLLDRLIDAEPDVSTEPAWRQVQSPREVQQSVLRDVEALLNTRCTLVGLPAGYRELICSSLTYGMPDFTSAAIASREERNQIRSAVQRTLERFEPRLRDVEVELSQEQDHGGRALRLTIQAILHTHPEPISVTFDTVLEPTTGYCKVESGESAT